MQTQNQRADEILFLPTRSTHLPELCIHTPSQYQRAKVHYIQRTQRQRNNKRIHYIHRQSTAKASSTILFLRTKHAHGYEGTCQQ
jgi:hypothetical protein